MKKFLMALLLLAAIGANAQITKVSLQASGLTCSICSKAVQNALNRLSFVEKVQVDIKSQHYNLSFKKDQAVDFDAMNKAVQEAGFSIAALKITALVSDVTLQKDQHMKIGEQHFHVLNSAGQTVSGEINFSLVDKSFVTAKAFKKYASMTRMPCVQTGKMAKCCTQEEQTAARIYHVVI